MKPTTSRAWYSFSEKVLYVDGERLTQNDYNAIWNRLPMTGAAWIEDGFLFVQDKDPEVGGQVIKLGEVEKGVK